MGSTPGSARFIMAEQNFNLQWVVRLQSISVSRKRGLGFMTCPAVDTITEEGQTITEKVV